MVKKESVRPMDAEQSYELRFPVGILGFEDITAYVLRQRGRGPVWELSPLEGEYPRFVIFAAESVVERYCPQIPQTALAQLEAKNPAELSFFAIAVVPQDISQTTINLRSPLAVNFQTGLAAQIVLETSAYPMRHPIFSEKGKVE